jgi:hypothetical protein
VRTWILLVALASLLALPIAPARGGIEVTQRARTVTRSFGNPAPIDLPVAASPASAALYPSTIEVRGLRGKLRDVNVRLQVLDQTYLADFEMLLVGPRGQTAIVLANADSAAGGDGATLRLDDEAAATVPPPEVGLPSGTFRPTNSTNQVIVFSISVPPVASGNAALSVFDDTDPNGT